MNKNESYTVLLNSFNSYTGGPTNNGIIRNFYFEWDVLPEQPYMVYTYFNSNGYVYNPGTSSVLPIITDLFDNVSSYSNNANCARLIAYICPNHNGPLSYAYWTSSTGTEYNLPLYIGSRPKKNNFTITIIQFDGNYFTDLASANDLGRYTITFKFVPITSHIMLKRDIPKQVILKNKKQSFTVVLNTQNAISNISNKEVDFYFDWSVMPDVPYHVFMSFVNTGAAGYISTYGTFPNLSIDCFDFNTYEPQLNKVSAITKNRLGYVETYSTGNNIIFSSKMITNPAVFIKGRPTKNSFRVSVYNNTLTSIFFAGFAPWVLILKFVELK